MKRRRVSEEESMEPELSEDSSSEEEEQFSKSDENEINRMVRQLSKSIPRQKAYDLLHSMVASKDILYWNSHGEMTHHQRRIPLTNMKELIEYALLPYNPDVRTPRGLKTFTSGLAELDLDKSLIRNKMLLADLVARQPEDDYDTDVSDEETESNNDITEESQEEHDSEEQEDSETESEEDEEEDEEGRECHACQEPKSFFKISVAQCPNCYWHEAYHSPQNKLVVCDVCSNLFALRAKNTKQMFYRCEDCNLMHTLSLKSNTFKPLVMTQGPREVDEE